MPSVPVPDWATDFDHTDEPRAAAASFPELAITVG